MNLRLGYGRSVEEYLAFGKLNVDVMLEMMTTAGSGLSPGSRVLDFGCGAGRMIRWLINFSSICEVWGADISAEHIVWCNQHLDPPFHFAVTTTSPHLPFEDRYFDLVYAGSVFTHIDDLAKTWFLELRRVLRPGGKLYVTVQDRHSIRLLNDEWRELPFAEFLRRDGDYAEFAASDFAMSTIGRGTGSHVFFYDLDRLRDHLRRVFHVVATKEGAYVYQTGLLLEKI